jgi:hypothetical protein
MKFTIHSYLLIVALAAALYSCSKDEDPAPPPTGENVPEEIVASPGDEVTFTGTFESSAGFASILLRNEDLLLNKEIVFANEVTRYFLDYSFTIPEDITSDIYPVDIILEDKDQNRQEFQTIVDVARLPEANGLVLNFTALPGDEITFTGAISDVQGISSISMQNFGIALDQVIELPENPNQYDLNYTYTIPASADNAVHNGTITINNTSNRSITLNMVVNLTGGDVTYDNIYAAGGLQWWPWNAERGYTMLKDPEDDQWFEITVPAWPEDDFNQIKFIGQLAWVPDNWGLVDNTDPSLGMVNAEDSAPILLDAAGSNFYPAYFKVRFNPYNMQYTTEEVDQTGFELQETMFIVGNGFTDYPALDWNPEEAIPMERNPSGFGDHIFLIEGLQFSDNVSLKFIGQNTGWGPLDIGFDPDYIVGEQDGGGFQVVDPISWLPTRSGSGSADLKFTDQAGSYTILYDHFAGRAIIWKE